MAARPSAALRRGLRPSVATLKAEGTSKRIWAGATSSSWPRPKSSSRTAASAAWSSSLRCHFTATEASRTRPLAGSLGSAIGSTLLLAYLLDQVNAGQRGDGPPPAVGEDLLDQRLAPGDLLLGRALKPKGFHGWGYLLSLGPNGSDDSVEVVPSDADVSWTYSISWQPVSFDPAPDGRRANPKHPGCLGDGVKASCSWLCHGCLRYRHRTSIAYTTTYCIGTRPESRPGPCTRSCRREPDERGPPGRLVAYTIRTPSNALQKRICCSIAVGLPDEAACR